MKLIKDYSKYATTNECRGVIPAINYKIKPKRKLGQFSQNFLLSGTDLDDENRKLKLDLDDSGE